jgi:hypothetical protein
MKRLHDIGAREYKVMLDTRPFANAHEAIGTLREELARVAQSLHLEVGRKAFNPADERWIVFLDSADRAFYRAGMILRQRLPAERGKAELTLKAMSPDRFIAAAADVRPARRKKAATKFEEDIGPPFRSRFAHSTTIAAARRNALDEATVTLADVAMRFPRLGRLEIEGQLPPASFALRPVNGLRAWETVFKGPKVRLGDAKASLAIILWTDGPQGRALVAELSCRYEVAERSMTGAIARDAFDFYREVLRMELSRPDSPSKTQYVYRAGATA